MKFDDLKKRMLAVNLDTPGAVGDLDSIILEFGPSAIDDLQRYLSTLESTDPRHVETKIRLCSAFIIRSIRDLNNDSANRKPAFEALGWVGTLALEGAMDIIEHSWIGSPDEDAVEYHYWACGVLSEFDSSSCEDRILERLTTATDVRKQVSLIQGLAVLADQNHLSGLRTTTVSRILELFRDGNQPSAIRNAAREALVEDFLRIDSYLHFLNDPIRIAIETIAAQEEQ